MQAAVVPIVEEKKAMPAPSRAQRRRQNARQTRRATDTATPRTPQPAIEEPVIEQGQAVAETIPSSRANPLSPGSTAATRPARNTRRAVARPVAEPVDYSEDYRHARRDIVRILVWSTILFGIMIALRFSGLV